MYLDGDLEDSSSSDSFNKINTAHAVTMKAKGVFTLEATKGYIEPLGSLSIIAGGGIVILDNLVSYGEAYSSIFILTVRTLYTSFLTLPSI